MGLVLQEEDVALSMGLRQVDNISARSRVVNPGMSKSYFFIVQGLHGLGEEGAKD